jgi:type II secretory pathway pseudopilin PulG
MRQHHQSLAMTAGGPGEVRSSEAGFTLVELIIALLLSSVMFSAMAVVFQTQTRVNTVQADVLESQQNARVAMNSLAIDIRQAGYFTDQFNRQPIWLDAAPYQLIFNANLSDQFVAMQRDSAVPLSDGTLYHPGDFTAAPQSENLPGFLDRYLNESETIRLTLDRTYDGLVTSADRQPGTANPNVYTLTKEINGNPPAVLAYNVRGPNLYPDGDRPEPIFAYWGVFTSPDSLTLWGDSDGNRRLSQAEITALTPVSRAQLPNVRQVDVTVTVETSRPDRRYEGPHSTSGNPYPYREYPLRARIRARNVGINPTGLILCGVNPSSPLNPVGYDTPYDRGGSLTIQWDSSPDEYSGEEDVQYYTIYRRLGPTGEVGVVGQVQAFGIDTTYVYQDDGDVDNFNAPVDYSGYYYYIAAWDCAPQESIPSTLIGPLVPLPNGPASPVITDGWDTPCDDGHEITLQFTRSPQDDGSETGVDVYVLYRGTLSDSTIITKILIDSLGTTGAAQYHYYDNEYNSAHLEPENGIDYWYIIRAVQSGVESENSNEFGPVRSGDGLSAPRLLSVTDRPADDGTGLILTWRRSMSETCSPPPTTYRIWRRVKGSGTFSVVASVTVTFFDTYTYTDDNGGSGLVNGTTYEYEIEVKTTDKAAFSNILEGTPRDNPPVAPPTNVTATDVPCESDGDIRVSWARSPDDGAGAFTADVYYVYRRLGTTGTWTRIMIIPATGAATYAWTDADSTNPTNPPVLGNVYWYRLTAYDTDSSSESNPSNEDSALSDGSPGAPEITAAYDTYGAGARSIRVEFLASVDDGGCSDQVTRYHVYRTTTPGAYGSWIGTVTATDAASYRWEDNLASSAAPPIEGFIYYYVVRAYDVVNLVESQNSNEFGPVEPYGASCECCPIFGDDMESGNVGWSHGGTRDDWELNVPNGKSFDPSLAHSGSFVWGTDLGRGSSDGQYRASADYYLITPTLDLSAFEEGYITLSYWRWLSVERYNKDIAQIKVDVGTGWQVVYQNPQADLVDTSWRLQYIDLSPYVRGHASVRIGWFLDTNNSTQFGGWNIDDVEICYTAPSPCDYFFYVGDSVAESQGNNLFFDITNGSDGAVTMLGMEMNWSAEGSLLKLIRTQAGGPGEVWAAATAQPAPLEALFDTPVPFATGETIKFKLQFQPGQMRGSAMSIRFITACGRSSEIVIQVPE